MFMKFFSHSPWPEDGIEFTTLWCRSINMSCAQWQLLLRDFPQPLLSMSELKMWGTLMAAEEQAPPRGNSLTLFSLFVSLRCPSPGQGPPATLSTPAISFVAYRDGSLFQGTS